MQLSLRASLRDHTSTPKIGQLNDRKSIWFMKSIITGIGFQEGILYSAIND